MTFKKYVCLSILYCELTHKPDFSGRNSLFKLESAQEATFCRRGKRSLYTSPPNSQPQFPQGQKPLSSPAAGTPQKHSQVSLMPSSLLPFSTPSLVPRKSQSLAADNKSFPRAKDRFSHTIPACPSSSWHNPKGSQGLVSAIEHKIQVTEVSPFPGCPTAPGHRETPTPSPHRLGYQGEKQGWRAHLGNSRSLRASEPTTLL